MDEILSGKYLKKPIEARALKFEEKIGSDE